MEIKLKIKELNAILDALEKDIDLTSLIIKFDSYEFLMKNRGKIENKFIIKHRENKEKLKTATQEIQQFHRNCKKILVEFEEEDQRLAQKK